MSDEYPTISAAIEELRRYNGNDEAYQALKAHVSDLVDECSRWKRAALAIPQTSEYESAWESLVEHGDHTEN